MRRRGRLREQALLVKSSMKEGPRRHRNFPSPHSLHLMKQQVLAATTSKYGYHISPSVPGELIQRGVRISDPYRTTLLRSILFFGFFLDSLSISFAVFEVGLGVLCRFWSPQDSGFAWMKTHCIVFEHTQNTTTTTATTTMTTTRINNQQQLL